MGAWYSKADALRPKSMCALSAWELMDQLTTPTDAIAELRDVSIVKLTPEHVDMTDEAPDVVVLPGVLASLLLVVLVVVSLLLVVSVFESLLLAHAVNKMPTLVITHRRMDWILRMELLM
jgi:hypothetical protein